MSSTGRIDAWQLVLEAARRIWGEANEGDDCGGVGGEMIKADASRIQALAQEHGASDGIAPGGC